MKVAILGFGSQGQAAFDYWNTGENQITICDADESAQLPETASARLGADCLANLEEFDLLVRTPSLHPTDIVAANPQTPNILHKVTTVTNEFFRVCPTKNLIGVTGTKGKGTTSTLITRMLEAAGFRVHLGGNIGIPPLQLLSQGIQPEDWVVLELANFQLIDICYSPHIAVCLMIAPEHLNWHTDMEEYITAKQQLFRWQRPNDVAIFYAENADSEKVATASLGHHIAFMQPPAGRIEAGQVMIKDQVICPVDDIQLLGLHNQQNVCAALSAAWQITNDNKALSSAIRNFTGLPFRLELRREKDDVRFFNDSFASATDATCAAVKAIPGQKVMIVGGFDRGLDLSDLVDCLVSSSEIRKVILVGKTGSQLADVLTKQNFDNFILSDNQDMNEIVQLAADQALPGDAVVLSPGFASFDMFKNFEDRGKQFNAAVEAL
jgi:UDP-N-acetylmuramoylalanine--D-glutamate ligase